MFGGPTNLFTTNCSLHNDLSSLLQELARHDDSYLWQIKNKSRARHLIKQSSAQIDTMNITLTVSDFAEPDGIKLIVLIHYNRLHLRSMLLWNVIRYPSGALRGRDVNSLPSGAGLGRVLSTRFSSAVFRLYLPAHRKQAI